MRFFASKTGFQSKRTATANRLTTWIFAGLYGRIDALHVTHYQSKCTIKSKWTGLPK